MQTESTTTHFPTARVCEPKRAADLEDKKVQSKARAARVWCQRASTVSDKPWKYLLIPHDQIAENRTFAHYVLNCGVAVGS